MRLLKLLPLTAALAVVAACSGGDKIVSPDELNNGPRLLSTDDSLFAVVQMSGAAYSTITAFRNIVTPPLPGLFGNVPPSPCAPTIVGNTDTNGNGIPDDRTQTYTAANCTYSNNGVSVVVTGSIREQDLGGLYGRRVTYSNYSIVGKKADSTFTTSVTGPIEYVFESATQARSLDGLAITIGTAATGGSATLTRSANFTTTFVPTSGSLSRNGFLPSGSLTLNGTLSISAVVTGNQIPSSGQSSQTISMNISTVTQMNANTNCTATQSLNTGEMKATVGGSQTGNIAMRFTACGSGPTGPTAPSGGGGTKK